MCRRTGGNSEEGTPVPIPNTEVKLFSSDDTLGAAPRENKTSPFHPPTWAVFLIESRAENGWEQLALPVAPIHFPLCFLSNHGKERKNNWRAVVALVALFPDDRLFVGVRNRHI